MEGKVIPTEEEFFNSVDQWIYQLTREGTICSCGFCKAKLRTQDEKSQWFILCDDCLAYDLCYRFDSAYQRWRNSWNDSGKEQANLEILEGLWEIGLKLRYFKE